LILLAFTLLGACDRAPEKLGAKLPPAVVGLIEPCQERKGEVRENCAIAALASFALTGEQWLLLCDELRTSPALDICIERAVWSDKSPSPPSVCERIEHERTRQSCLLGATNGILEGPIAALADACGRAEDLEVDCWVHVTTGRKHYWLDKGLSTLEADVAEMLAVRPALVSSIPVGYEVGRALGPVAQGSPSGVCARFEAGPAQACYAAVK
jgi:hypothetical protein